jgi:hypothetical protein
MDALIKNSWDLKEEIVRLKELEKKQGAALVTRVNSPGAVFSTVYSIFSSSKPNPGGSKTNIFNQDFVSVISRFLIPITLNKTLFKNSGFIVKALVGLLSQKASGYVNEDAVVSIWDKVKGLLGKKSEKVDQRYPYGL